MTRAMLILASESPRRRQLMHLITDSFTTARAEVDERAYSAADLAALVRVLACAKAQAAAARFPAAAVIGADTVVDLGGRVFGKPADAADAERMLRALSGRTHLVHTGVCVVCGGVSHALVETTEVTFAPLSSAEIGAYIASGEPFGKAGAYAVQGGAARFVLRIEGCYYNVMGLPVAALYRLLRGLGLLPET